MGSDPAPDDVGVAVTVFGSVDERGPAVGSEGHLEDAGSTLHAFHSQARPEGSRLEVGDERSDRRLECRSLDRGESLDVTAEPLGGFVGRQGSYFSGRDERKASGESWRWVRPAAMSADASRSPACHSGVQNQA